MSPGEAIGVSEQPAALTVNGLKKPSGMDPATWALLALYERNPHTTRSELARMCKAWGVRGADGKPLSPRAIIGRFFAWIRGRGGWARPV